MDILTEELCPTDERVWYISCLKNNSPNSGSQVRTMIIVEPFRKTYFGCDLGIPGFTYGKSMLFWKVLQWRPGFTDGIVCMWCLDEFCIRTCYRPQFHSLAATMFIQKCPTNSIKGIELGSNIWGGWLFITINKRERNLCHSTHWAATSLVPPLAMLVTDDGSHIRKTYVKINTVHLRSLIIMCGQVNYDL